MVRSAAARLLTVQTGRQGGTISSVTVLIADDESDLRLLVRTQLSRAHGWAIVEAGDGEEALERCRAGGVDLVVLDHRMPRRLGIDVIRALREEGNDVPIVLFSAYLDPELEDEVARAGAVSVPKSDIASLVEVTRSLLEARRASG